MSVKRELTTTITLTKKELIDMVNKVSSTTISADAVCGFYNDGAKSVLKIIYTTEAL